MVKLVQQQKGDPMADLSELPDDTPQEEYDRRTRERYEQMQAQRQKGAEDARDRILQQTYSSGQKEAQLQRIEDKLDRILRIIDDGK